jgi:hypothetical protein
MSNWAALFARKAKCKVKLGQQKDRKEPIEMPPIEIPNDLQENPHFFAIKGFLHSLLNELVASGTEAKRVVSRLNDSSKDTPAPVFVGVVEDEEITRLRRGQQHPHQNGDVGIKRFKADKNPSIVYEKTLTNPAGVQKRDWSGADIQEKNPGGGRNPKSLGPTANCKFQRFIAIRVGRQHVGTITVGFANDPTQQENKIQQIMQKWAQDQNSEYIKYLRATFKLNGPTV